MKFFTKTVAALSLSAAALFTSCGKQETAPKAEAPAETKSAEGESLYIYCGRKTKYATPLFDLFTKETGIKIEFKEGKTAELAAVIAKEGENSPADIFFAQDSSNLGSLSAKGLISELPKEVLEQVDARYRAPQGTWVGTSGRARVLVYNKDLVKKEELPQTMEELTSPAFKGKVGWAPKNGSFQSHIVAMKEKLGVEATTAWVKGMKANGAKDYPKNTPIVKAVNAGEIPMGLVNHYYLYKVTKDMGPEDIKAENHFFKDGSIGLFVNISGVAVVKSTKKKALAEKFVAFLLSKPAQELFKNKNFEYPLAQGVTAVEGLKPLAEINPVKVDLGSLDKLEETQKLLKDAGAL